MESRSARSVRKHQRSKRLDGARRSPRRPKAGRRRSTHEEAKRQNIPTAELQSFAEQQEETRAGPPVRYAARHAAAEGRDARARRGPRPADRLERRAHPPDTGAGAAAAGDRRGRDRRRAARLARQGPAGLVRPRGQRAAALHPGEGPPQGDHRRSEAPHEGERARRRATRRTCSPISTASTRRRAPSSTSTTSTGRTA